MEKVTDLQAFLALHGTKRGIELLQEDPYNLKFQEDGRRILFTYDMINSDLSNSIVQECRGIVLDRETLKIYCRPFDKFFNLGESKAYDLNWDSGILIQEKLDGSLIKLYYYDLEDRWVFATNGTIEFNDQQEVLLPDYGKDLVTFDNLIADIVNLDEQFFDQLNTELTYLFELIHPNNPIVVNDGNKSLTLIGIRDRNTGDDFVIDAHNDYVFTLLDNAEGQISIPDVYKVDQSQLNPESINELVNDKNPDNKCNFEGFIVSQIKDGRILGRNKVKSLQYLFFHRISQPKEAVNVFLKGFQEGEEDEFDAYIENAPDHIKSIYHSYRNAFHELIQDLNETVENDRSWFNTLVSENDPDARKKVALHLKDQPNGKLKMSMIFNQLGAREYLKGMNFKSFKKMLKSKIKK